MQFFLVAREDDVAVPCPEVPHGLFPDRRIGGHHPLACGNAVLTVDNLELPLLELVPVVRRDVP